MTEILLKAFPPLPSGEGQGEGINYGVFFYYSGAMTYKVIFIMRISRYTVV